MRTKLTFEGTAWRIRTWKDAWRAWNSKNEVRIFLDEARPQRHYYYPHTGRCSSCRPYHNISTITYYGPGEARAWDWCRSKSTFRGPCMRRWPRCSTIGGEDFTLSFWHRTGFSPNNWCSPGAKMDWEVNAYEAMKNFFAIWQLIDGRKEDGCWLTGGSRSVPPDLVHESRWESVAESRRRHWLTSQWLLVVPSSPLWIILVTQIFLLCPPNPKFVICIW